MWSPSFPCSPYFFFSQSPNSSFSVCLFATEYRLLWINIFFFFLTPLRIFVLSTLWKNQRNNEQIAKHAHGKKERKKMSQRTDSDKKWVEQRLTKWEGAGGSEFRLRHYFLITLIFLLVTIIFLLLIFYLQTQILNFSYAI